MDARLRVLSGPHAGETIQVGRGKLLIGREEDCHLRPESEFVSRHHCVLLLDDYTLRIRDLGSKNGTFVNGRRIGTSETILLHDDMISIGEMIGQIDLSQPGIPVPSGLPGEEPGTQALHGTGYFEGDTVQAQSPFGEPPSTRTFSQPQPQEAVPPQEGENSADTKTVFPAPPQSA
jgi:hypothetical protein